MSQIFLRKINFFFFEAYTGVFINVTQSTRFQRQPTDSEAGAPTEIMKNIRRLSAGAAETSSLSFHYHSQPTDSEAGAPTEIIDNKRMLHRPYHLRRPSTGDGGNQVLLKDRYNSNNSDILSRVRNRYQNQSFVSAAVLGT